jgi:glycosyltransferase involved in cell wall biosynthesis
MTVSLAMIVRDEELELARCLDSVRGAADDLVIVDTGSTDRTRDVAASYGARVFDFPWRKDFAAARQHAFDQATSDWVFWLDADDVVLNAGCIKQDAASAASDLKGYYWCYIAARDADGRPTCEFWRERLVRHDGTFRWRGRVHEVLVAPPGTRTQRATGVAVVHERDPTKARNRYRNIEILADEYEQTRQCPEPRLLLYLGFEYLDLGDVDLGVAFLRQFLACSSWAEQNYLVHLRVAALLRGRRQYEPALAEARTAMGVLPDWPNAYFSMAETYYFLGDWPNVVAWTEVGRRLPVPEPICPHDPMDVRFRWMIHFTNALYRVGRTSEALDWTDAALAVCPSDTWHLHNRAFFAGELVTAG